MKELKRDWKRDADRKGIGIQKLSKASERSERALGSEENSCCSLLIDSEMAGQIRLKLGGMVEGIAENVLAKEFFWIC